MQHARSPEQAQYASSPVKNHVTSKSPVGDISVVTLIRTDTTLDHSQKAEKVWADHGVEEHKQFKYVTRSCLNGAIPSATRGICCNPCLGQPLALLQDWQRYHEVRVERERGREMEIIGGRRWALRPQKLGKSH